MPTQEERIAHEKQIAQQQEELSRLRGEPHKPKEPWRKIDWTARMSMPPSAIAEMVRAVPDRVVREVTTDSLRRPPPTPPPSAEPKKGTGWRELEPLKPPPGIELLDRMMDVEDAKDKAALIDKAIRSRLK
jgi:hypothetical protein